MTPDTATTTLFAVPVGARNWRATALLFHGKLKENTLTWTSVGYIKADFNITPQSLELADRRQACIDFNCLSTAKVSLEKMDYSSWLKGP